MTGIKRWLNPTPDQRRSSWDNKTENNNLREKHVSESSLNERLLKLLTIVKWKIVKWQKVKIKIRKKVNFEFMRRLKSKIARILNSHECRWQVKVTDESLRQRNIEKSNSKWRKKDEKRTIIDERCANIY